MEKNLFDNMIQDRRKIHMCPEEGWTEFDTTYYIVCRLKEMGYQTILTGRQMIDPDSVMGRNPAVVREAIERAERDGVPHEFIEKCDEYTGAVAILGSGRPGPVMAFRFDIDGLCVQESDSLDHLPTKQGFASKRSGRMHACGHDGHTAVGLAVAQWLIEHQEELNGTFKLIFQPAEEGVRGAAAIVGSGLLDDVNFILGSHCGGRAKLGQMALVHGGVLASIKYDIFFKGTPSHAGSSPQTGHSALMAACATSMMLVGIPRHGEGVSRVAVGTLHAGEGRNITPVHAKIECEIRGETEEVLQYLAKNVEKIVRGNAISYEVESRIEKAGYSTTLIECPEILETLREIGNEIPEVKEIIDLNEPVGGEDYTLMIKRVVEKGGRGAMFRWGCNHHGHHKGDFDLQDTESMSMGFEVFTRFAKKINGR